MGMLSEFKAFIARGNVVDLAVAVVIGAAFGKIVTALVEGIVMPIIALITGGTSVADWKYVVTPAQPTRPARRSTPEVAFKYGLVLQTLIDFVLIAFVIFLFLKAYNRLRAPERRRPRRPKTCCCCARSAIRSRRADRLPNARAVRPDHDHQHPCHRRGAAATLGVFPQLRVRPHAPCPDDARRRPRRHARRRPGRHADDHEFHRSRSQHATQLRERALADNTGWKVVESLTTEVGPRMAGSEADARAVAWAEAKFKSLGFDACGPSR